MSGRLKGAVMEQEYYTRAVKLSLKFITASKRRRLMAIYHAYVKAVNSYLRLLQEKGSKVKTNDLGGNNLTGRYRGVALWQAKNIWKTTKASAKTQKKKARVRGFRGTALFSENVVVHGPRQMKGGFDYAFEFTSLRKVKGKSRRKLERIVVLTKKTKVLNKWLSIPGARIRPGCGLNPRYLIVYVEIPKPAPKEVGKEIGLDCNFAALLVDSEGRFYGERFKEIMAKVLRRQQGSKGSRRARIERDHYINYVVKRLPWQHLKAVAIEDLRNIKKGKRPRQTRKFRRALSVWAVRNVRQAITLKAQENGVRLVVVAAEWTSCTCPKCGQTDKASRKDREFKCSRCGHTQHADVVGAVNISRKAFLTAGSLVSPVEESHSFSLPLETQVALQTQLTPDQVLSGGG